MLPIVCMTLTTIFILLLINTISHYVIGNTVKQSALRLDENIDTLKQLINEPCLGVIPKLSDKSPQHVATFLTVPD